MSDLIETGTDAIFQLGLRLTKAEAEQVFHAALSAIEKNGTHVLMPTKPTEEMKTAFSLNSYRSAATHGHPIDDTWPALIAARPLPDAPIQNDSAKRIEELEGIIRAILEADERGQGLPFAEAMERANKAVRPPLPEGEKT